MIIANPYDAPIELEDILRIERLAYPESLQEMQWAEQWEDIADYAQVPLRRLVVLSDGMSWYAIIAKHRLGRAEFVDLAKVPGAPALDWLFLLEQLRRLKIKKVFADLRDDTSYRRFKKQMQRMPGVRLLQDEPYQRDGELFHDVVIQI